MTKAISFMWSGIFIVVAPSVASLFCLIVTASLSVSIKSSCTLHSGAVYVVVSREVLPEIIHCLNWRNVSREKS